MDEQAINSTDDDLETVAGDELLRLIPRDDFVGRLRSELEDLPPEEQQPARQILMNQTSLESGLAVGTAAPDLLVDSITWFALPDPHEEPSRDNLRRHIRMALQHVESHEVDVLVVEASSGLADYPTMEKPEDFWNEVLCEFPTSQLSEVRLVT